MEQVVVVVPIYKKQLSVFEQISLQQLIHVLHKWHIIFLLPNRLRGWEPVQGRNCIYISDNNFTNVASYSRLLMSDHFYALFAEYEYMLIYQLDAFVFSDQLQEFCELGYDYIGAPWPFYLGSPSRYHARVGNGGFSLRRIAAVRRVLKQKEMIFAKEPQFIDWFSKVEDGFFGYCGIRPELNFHVPDVQMALKFSMEHKIAKYLPVEKGIKPFGCHGWYKLNYAVWKPIIASYGYSLPETVELEDTTEELRLNYMAYYLCQRKIRVGGKSLLKECFQEIIPTGIGQVYKIWGGGVVGKALLGLMQSVGNAPVAVYDRNGVIDGVSCKVEEPPTREALQKKDSVILVATTKYYRDIEGFLIKAGMVEGRDFISGTILLRRLAGELYPCMRNSLVEGKEAD